MKQGDIIEFDYDLWVEGHEGLYDTTDPQHAQEAGIGEAGAYYAPMRYVVGAGRLIAGLEKELLKAEVGKRFEIEIMAEQAYGERDPAKIETVPMAEFRRNKVEARPGVVVTWRNRRGVIQTVGGGRVRVDFNPVLAGKSLRYAVTVRKVFATPEERVKGVFLMNYPSSDEPGVAAVVADAKVVQVTLPESAKYDPNWIRAKFAFLAAVREHTGFDTVRLVEDHPLAREEPPAEPAVGSPGEAAPS